MPHKIHVLTAAIHITCPDTQTAIMDNKRLINMIDELNLPASITMGGNKIIIKLRDGYSGAAIIDNIKSLCDIPVVNYSMPAVSLHDIEIIESTLSAQKAQQKRAQKHADILARRAFDRVQHNKYKNYHRQPKNKHR